MIQRYQRAADEHDWDSLVACFTEDACVVDEGETYVGLDAIRRWREEAASKYIFTSTVVISVREEKDFGELLEDKDWQPIH